MTKIEYLMIKLCLAMARPITFPEMVEAIGEDQYLLCHRTLEHMLQKKWMDRDTRKDGPWIFVHRPTLQGLEVYEGKHDQYPNAGFVVPIQRGC
jgi:hypothetical protein